jgi:hypothetical protein
LFAEALTGAALEEVEQNVKRKQDITKQTADPGDMPYWSFAKKANRIGLCVVLRELNKLNQGKKKEN